MFFSILIVHFFGLLLPGPDFLLVSSYALKNGVKSALKASFGVSVAMSIWIILSVLGLSVIFHQFPFLQIILSSCGAFYLLYLAFIIYKNAKNGKLKMQKISISPFFSGFLTNLSNPKVIFYFASVFATFNFDAMQSVLLVMVVILFLETFVYFSLIGILFSNTFIIKFYEKKIKLIDYLSAFIFLIFALYVLLSNLYYFAK
ncbi:LysE family translocator [Campylobacter insulaenigrae]|uniref:LysE family translocator n=1 Tax=Campylobacter insulaenigrae TaxID=260714 RepID=UPI002152B5E8|nr:LysE family translocator [Campylobacter insulaenigrae]MCR6575269.1 LysE family translocator [Campylobacter insulaenigrae]